MKLGIGVKILVPVILSVALVIAIVTMVLGNAMNKTLHEEYLSKGTALVKGLASSAQDTLQNRDASWTQGFIDEYKGIKGVAHVYVLDQHGRVVGHTFVPAFPDQLLKHYDSAEGRPLNSNIEISEVTINGKKRLNIEAPILMGTLGSAVVGMDLDLLNSELRRAIGRVIFFGVFIGGLACLFLLWVLSKPIGSILYLSAVSQRVGMGEEVYPEENRFAGDEIGDLAKSFTSMLQQLQYQKKNLEKMVGERTVELEGANQSIDAMINSVGQGFLAFDRNGICQKNFSKACIGLLECNPAGKPLWDILKLPTANVENFSFWVGSLFDEPLPFESLTDVGPKKFRHSDSQKYISIEYKPIRDTAGKVALVVLIATDRSAENAARAAMERERAFTSMIMKIAREKDQFLTFARESRECVRQLEAAIGDPSHLPRLEALIREVHTLKGGAAAFSFFSVKELAHRLESTLCRLSSTRENELRAFLPTMREETERIKQALEETMEIARGILGRSSDHSQRYVEIPVADLLIFSDEIETLKDHRSVKNRFVEQFIVEPIGKFFSHYEEMARDIAARQGKSLAPLKVVNPEIKIVAEPYLGLFNSIIHAVRNAIDHGLETPIEREEAGKDPSGSLEIHFTKENDGLKIVIRDDGRGVDPEVLRAKLQAQNRRDWLSKPLEELIQVVFENGFSTLDAVTDLSGRGIGLNAIQQIARSLGGEARIASEIGRGTTLEIRVPEVAMKKRPKPPMAA